MHVSTVQVIVFIYGIGLVLSCQIQDDLSLYYNMVAANSKGPTMQGKSVQTKGTLNDSKPATGEGLITQSL